jgi:hypothetical protein
MSKTQGDHVGETNKMITAVEWIVEQLQAPCRGIPSHIIDKAKEMEKKQIIDAYDTFVLDDNSNFMTAEQYYNETFNK